MTLKNLALAVSTLFVTACGANAAMQGNQAQDDRSSEDGTAQSDDAAPKKKKAAAKAEKANGSETDELDCSGIPLHEGHETCDGDDVKVADGTDLPDAKETSGTSEDEASTDPGEPGDEPAEQPTPAEPGKPAEPVKDPNVVEFRIAAGTGTKPLNTPATFVQAKVGQTLRFINDDSVTHRFHTGGTPCPHGSNFAPGATYDCVLTKAIDTVANPGALYEHISGPTALFYLKVTN